MPRARARARLRRLIDAFLAAYAGSQAEHRVLTEDVRFLAPAEKKRVLGGQRRVVAAFADAIVAIRPELARSTPAEAAGDAAVRHDELDVHLAAARRAS